MRIKYQILLIAMIPVILIDAFFTWVPINSSINQADQLLQSKGEVIAQQIASASEFNMLAGNHEQIQHLLDVTVNKNNIVYLALYGIDGNIIAQAKSPDFKDDGTPDYSYYRHPIKTQNLDMEDIFQTKDSPDDSALRTLGWIHMYISRNHLIEGRQQIFIEGGIFFISMLMLAILLTLTISRRLTRPIYALLNHLKRVETGHLGETIDKLENNEIGDVQKGFNSMSQALLANRMQLDQKIKNATLDLMNAITSLEYNNRELSIARDKAQQADRIKTQFLANMSHEIRTPINGIQGFINLLARSGLQPDQQRYVDIITRSTEDLTNIVTEILDFSKIESDKIELVKQPFDLYELLETTRDSLFAGAMQKGIDLYLCIYSDTPSHLIGDPFRIKQILINLIGNALKFTDRGFISVTVMLEDESEDNVMLRIEIEDSGIGISEEDQKNLFQAFKQIESDTNRRYTGTGLGLVISQNLARLMGGDIRLHSELEKGSRFTLLTPLQKDPEHTEDLADDDKTAFLLSTDARGLKEIQTLYNRAGYTTETALINAASNIEQLHHQLKINMAYLDLIVLDLRHEHGDMHQLIDDTLRAQCRVIIMHYDQTLVNSELYPDCQFISIISHSSKLEQNINPEQDERAHDDKVTTVADNEAKNLLIVDDNPINLALACELTRIWGHHPQQASNANDAMKLFRSQRFDLILLDIQMPEIDGVQLMQMMREFKPDLAIPIVAITANVLDEERERLLNLGFDAFISKPIDESKLQGLLNRQYHCFTHNAAENKSNWREESVDYDLTRKLSANNVKLMKATFSMLQLELPQYVQEITLAIDAEDDQQISAITHKLKGVCCYAGLPELKRLLEQYDDAKKIDKAAILSVCRDIRAELQRIEDVLQQHSEAGI